jgi:hypothetical protein
MRRLILKHGGDVPRVSFYGICKLAGVFLGKKRVFVFIECPHCSRCLRFPHTYQVDRHLLFDDFRPFLLFMHLFLIRKDPELGHAPHDIPLSNVPLMGWLPVVPAHQGLGKSKTDEIIGHFVDLVLGDVLFDGLRDRLKRGVPVVGCGSKSRGDS